MRRKHVQALVSVVSVAIGLVGLALFMFLRIRRQPVPLLDDVAMSYGLIFTVFLLFDRVSKQAAQFRSESDAEKPQRPVPFPKSPGQQVVPAGAGNAADHEVALERLRPEQREVFQSMLDTAIREVLALDGEVPETGNDGHVQHPLWEAWMANPSGHYLFFIVYREQKAGLCALQTGPEGDESLCELQAFYVESSQRRKRIGGTAMKRLQEFASLLGVQAMSMELSGNNMRGKRFLNYCGFVRSPQAQDAQFGGVRVQPHDGHHQSDGGLMQPEGTSIGGRHTVQTWTLPLT